MQFIENSFADKVRSNKIKSPLRADFSVEKWNEAKKVTEFDNNLFEAGLYFHSQFECIRDHLGQLNKISLSLTKEDYLKIFIGMSNRDAKVNIDNITNILSLNKPPKFDLEFYGIQTSNNFLGNLYSINEIAVLSVDSIFYNVLTHLNEDSNVENTILNQEDKFKIIRTENLLSQLYYSYEQLWNSILYEQTEFKIDDNKVYLNDNSALSIYSVINETRNSKLVANHTILNYEYYKELINDFTYLIYKNDKISYESFFNLELSHQNSIINCLSSFYANEVINYIPNTLPNLNFNIDEVISVFIQLNSLSHGIIKALDSDTSITPANFRKFETFNKLINITELCDFLALVIGIDLAKITQIIEFLTFTNKRVIGPRIDLWRSPIVKINEDECLLVLEPLLHPVGLRCFEGWMAKAVVDISQKGAAFENHIKEEIKQLFDANIYIDKYDFFERDILSIEGQKEEIDLLFKIGNLVILGEAKCVVTSDSATSIWNTLEIIKHASEQALRKLDFVSENFKTICTRFNWDYDENLNYNFQPIAIISNGFGVGSNFFGVPILDQNILFSYFKNGTIPLISTANGEDLAFLKIYNSSDELKNNFSTFIYNPPTVETYKLSINHLTPIELISCKDEYKKMIQQTRLGISDINPEKILDHNFGFELVRLEGLESFLAIG